MSNGNIIYIIQFFVCLNSRKCRKACCVDVYVIGSNSKFLSSDIVTEFRGRGNEIRIYPLVFAEFYATFDGEYEDV